jgi:hypothetical protein
MLSAAAVAVRDPLKLSGQTKIRRGGLLNWDPFAWKPPSSMEPDTFTLNSPEHGSGKKRSHPAYL